MNIRNIFIFILSVIYAVLWFGGVMSYTILEADPSLQPITAPMFLWCAAVLSLIGLSSRRHVFWLLLASCIAFIAEIIGVATGTIFGSYRYGNGFGMQLFNVPLAIMAAWLILLAYVWHITSRFHFSKLKISEKSKINVIPRSKATRNLNFLRKLSNEISRFARNDNTKIIFQKSQLLKALIAAGWMVAIDVIIDPVSAGPIGFWEWTAAGSFYGIPLSNFLGWFVVSLPLFLFLQQERFEQTSSHLVGFSIMLFFTVLAALSFPIVALFGVLLLAADIVVLRSEWLNYGRIVEGSFQNFFNRRRI